MVVDPNTNDASDARQQLPADETVREQGENKPPRSRARRQRLAQLGVDPINYDLTELRTLSDGDHTDESHTEPKAQYRTHIADPTPEQYHRLLVLCEIDPETIGEKPYLTTLPTEVAGGFVTDWLAFLTQEAGTDGAIEAIDHYQTIGWFTERVEQRLCDGMLWVDHHDGNRLETLDRADHLLSFAYVAKIASVSTTGMKFF